MVLGKHIGRFDVVPLFEQEGIADLFLAAFLVALLLALLLSSTFSMKAIISFSRSSGIGSNRENLLSL